MTQLSDATRIERVGPQHFRTEVPDGWQQGRGAFGGVVLGVLTRALEAAADDAERALRSLSGEIVGPVLPGEARIDVEVLRRGSGVTTLSATLRQAGEVLARASGVFGKGRAEQAERASWIGLDPPAPAILSSRARSASPEAAMPPRMAPAFVQHFEMTPTGPLPFSGGSDAVASGWVRARTPPSRFEAADIVAYADTWWPAHFSIERAPRPMATIAFTLELCLDPATLTPDAPLYHRARSVSAHAGYVVELRELWTHDARLVALNQQTFVIIK